MTYRGRNRYGNWTRIGRDNYVSRWHILQTLVEWGECSCKQIGAVWEIRPQTARKQLIRLHGEGYVKKVKRGRHINWVLGTQAYKKLRKYRISSFIYPATKFNEPARKKCKQRKQIWDNSVPSVSNSPVVIRFGNRQW